MARKENPLYRAWRRAWGEDWLRQEIRLLRFRRLPWIAVCSLTKHKWGEKNAVITCGPIGAHPRERDYQVLAFHHQCKRCYMIEDVPYTVHEKLAAIEEELRVDINEWAELKALFEGGVALFEADE